MFVTNFIIVGRVIQPPNIIEPYGYEILKFVVETKTWYKGKERTETHEILAFGERKIDYLKDIIKAGETVAVNGTIGGKTFADHKGNTRYQTSLKAESVTPDRDPESKGRARAPEQAPPSSDNDDLPF